MLALTCYYLFHCSKLCTWFILDPSYSYQHGLVCSIPLIFQHLESGIKIQGHHFFSFPLWSPGVAFWTQTGERQTARLRLRYLQSVLRKKIEFFDTDTRAKDIIFHISSDAILVQDAIGDKVINEENIYLVVHVELL